MDLLFTVQIYYDLVLAVVFHNNIYYSAVKYPDLDILLLQLKNKFNVTLTEMLAHVICSCKTATNIS